MNALTSTSAPTSSTRIPVAIAQPKLSPELSRAVGHYIDPTWGRLPGPEPVRREYVDPEKLPVNPMITLPRHGKISDEAREEAKRYLDELRLYFRPAGRDMLRSWLFPMNGAFRNPCSEDDFDARFQGIALAVASFPVLAFTEETQCRVLLAHKFWPSAADIGETLNEVIEPVKARGKALRALLDYRPPPPAQEWTPPTEAERHAVRKTWQDHLAWLAERRPDAAAEQAAQ